MVPMRGRLMVGQWTLDPFILVRIQAPQHMAYIKSGTHKSRRRITFKNWRRHISGKEKWQATILRKKISDDYERLMDS